ncbi:TPR domain protein [Stanieria sp. NIES-3757]|nr:TPR domain protein [Stanieria sp. NIES-3757]
MFKLLKTFLDSPTNSESSSQSNEKPSVDSDHQIESQLKEADDFRQQGKLTEAITIYRQAIEQTSHLATRSTKSSITLQQNNNLALAYEQLATAYKQKGQVEQAANYYRQAIIFKSLNWQQAKQSFKSNSQAVINQLLKKDSLLNSAFAFQPLSAQNRQKLANFTFRSADSNSYYPLFSGEVNKINSQQTITIEWEAAQIYLQQALESCDRHNWQQAAIACKQATQLCPNLAEAYKIWGNALQRMGKTAEAMDCYAKAVEIQPDLAKVYAKVASLYAGQNKWQQAIEYYQKAIIIKPTFAEAYRNLAQIWEQLNQPEKAQLYHSKFLELEALNHQTQTNAFQSSLANSNLSPTQSVATYQEIAQNLEKQNKWQEAANYYRKALELNLSQSQPRSDTQPTANSTINSPSTPQLARLKQVQQLLHQSSDDLANQTTLLTSVSETSENTASPVRERGLQGAESSSAHSPSASSCTQGTQSGTKQIDKAIERYQKQAQLKPDSAKTQLDLGNLYAKQQQWQTAINCYHKALKINYQYAEAYWYLADALEKIGKTSDSLEHRYQALSLKPDLAPASEHVYLGRLLQKQGNLEQAVICYRQAIGLKPQFIPAYYRLGQILSLKGEQQEAIACYRQAIQYDPHNAELYFLLGQELAEEKQWNQAVQAYRRVLELKPTYPQASYRLNYALAEKLKLDLQKR